MNHFYVYALCDPTLPLPGMPGTPFYVGKGKGNRWESHLRETKSKHTNARKFRYIYALREKNIVPEVHFLKKNLTEKEALELEKTIVDFLGRYDIDDHGTLLNVVPGGSITPKHDGIPKTNTHKANLSKARMGHKDSDATRAAKSRGHTGKLRDAAHRQAISDGLKGHEISQATRDKLREKIARRYLVTAPDGTQYEVNNLREWAPAQGLSYQCLLKVANGTKASWNSWLCRQL